MTETLFLLDFGKWKFKEMFEILPYLVTKAVRRLGATRQVEEVFRVCGHLFLNKAFSRGEVRIGNERGFLGPLQ